MSSDNTMILMDATQKSDIKNKTGLTNGIDDFIKIQEYLDSIDVRVPKLIARNKIDNIIDIFKNREIIGEITIVIKGFERIDREELNKSKLKKELEELINAGLSLSAASKYLAKKKNLTKNLIYNLY